MFIPPTIFFPAPPTASSSANHRPPHHLTVYLHRRPLLTSMVAPSSAVVPALTLLFSLPLLYLFFAPRLLSFRQIAISLPEELDDLSLFHKAIAMESANFSFRNHLSAAKSHISASIRRPMIAFLFLAKSPLHFPPLWECFYSNANTQHYDIYIHADPLAKIAPLRSIFRDRLIPAKRTQHSSATLISAAHCLLAVVMLDDPTNTYFAIISQHCILLHSFNYLYNFLFDLS